MEKEFMEKVLAKLDKQEEDSKQILLKLDEHDKQFEQIFAKLNEHDKQFEQIFTKLNEHDKRFEQIFAKLDEHDEKFEQIFAKLDEHDEKFEQVFAKLNEHDKKFADHDKEFRNLKDCLMVIEVELFNKIKALFDGYTINQEKGTELESRQSSTEQKVEVNSLRISVLEDASKEHTEQISKLLAK